MMNKRLFLAIPVFALLAAAVFTAVVPVKTASAVASCVLAKVNPLSWSSTKDGTDIVSNTKDPKFVIDTVYYFIVKTENCNGGTLQIIIKSSAKGGTDIKEDSNSQVMKIPLDSIKNTSTLNVKMVEGRTYIGSITLTPVKGNVIKRSAPPAIPTKGSVPPVNTAIVDLKKPIIDFERPVTDDIQALIQRIVNSLLSLIATVAVIFIIVGGFRLAFSQGNQEAVAKGKKTLTWAIAGLAVALLTFAIINAITQLLY